MCPRVIYLLLLSISIMGLRKKKKKKRRTVALHYNKKIKIKKCKFISCAKLLQEQFICLDALRLFSNYKARLTNWF